MTESDWSLYGSGSEQPKKKKHISVRLSSRPHLAALSCSSAAGRYQNVTIKSIFAGCCNFISCFYFVGRDLVNEFHWQKPHLVKEYAVCSELQGYRNQLHKRVGLKGDHLIAKSFIKSLNLFIFCFECFLSWKYPPLVSGCLLFSLSSLFFFVFVKITWLSLL